MIDEDFSSFLEGVFGENRTVGCDLEGELIVVGLLVDAEVFNRVLDVLDRGVGRVDSDNVYLVVGILIFLSGNPATTLVDGHYDCETCARIQMTDDKLGIRNFESAEGFANVTGCELLSA